MPAEAWSGAQPQLKPASICPFSEDAAAGNDTLAQLDTSKVVTSGASPDLVVTGLTGATLIVDNLYENLEDEDGFLVYNWIIDTNVPAGTNIFKPSTTDTIFVAFNNAPTETVAISRRYILRKSHIGIAKMIRKIGNKNNLVWWMPKILTNKKRMISNKVNSCIN